MSSIGVNPPHTPVTEGSGGKAFATTPNVCKMPGPPAPFVPTPLPNLGTSGDNLTDGTTTVKFEGKKVAIKGSYFMSQPSGDVASQGTGGGIVSSKTQGKTEWMAPGSMDVKADGKNIQLLGDAMGNNGGSPVNAATMKELQEAIGVRTAKALCKAICEELNTGPQQSDRAEKKFIANRPDWESNRNSFKLKTAPGSCRPDLYNSKTKKFVEIKMMPKEKFTKEQETFQDELARKMHRPHRKKDFIKVTPKETCNCPGA
jgi:uncharacterized Zn-binding protein involved in type VI secretion